MRRNFVVVNANGEFIEPVFTEDEMDIYEISHQELLDFRRGSPRAWIVNLTRTVQLSS